jgi:uncharacterized protein YodC (DUF2158 family)
MNEFDIGDVVRLNSGGPAMTIVGKTDAQNHMISCAWFTADGLIHAAAFHVEALKETKADS